VMMLLLVIFMITAPLMQGGVDVKLPVADARPLENKSAIVITVDRAGRIFLDRDQMTYGEFSAAAKTLLQKGKQQGVTVRADARANVEMLLRVVAVIRNAGVTSVGLVTDQEPPR